MSAINNEIEIIFTVIYSLEMLLKWIAFGWFGFYEATKEDEDDYEEQPMSLVQATDSVKQKQTSCFSVTAMKMCFLFCF